MSASALARFAAAGTFGFAWAAQTAAATAGGAIAVHDAWSRPAVTTGVVYATIVNRGDRADRIVAASTPIAARVEMHASRATATSDTMDGMPMNGTLMSMEPLRDAGVPARGGRTFAPGGDHFMLVGLHRRLARGNHFTLTLRFAHAGRIDVAVNVR